MASSSSNDDHVDVDAKVLDRVNYETMTLEEIHTKLSTFLKRYNHFYNLNKEGREEKIVDFFIFDHFHTTMNPEWNKTLMHMSTEDLLDMSHYDTSHLTLPNDLVDFIHQCKEFSHIPSFSHKEQSTTTSHLPSILQKGMNPKKKHEVHILSQFIRNLSKTTQCHTICDIGGGQGYLTQQIAIDQSMNHDSQISHIFTIDCNNKLTENARNRIQQIHNLLDRFDMKNNRTDYKAITSHLSFSLNDDEFNEIVHQLNNLLVIEDHSHNDNCCSHNDSSHTEESFSHEFLIQSGVLLIGLHTCGPLASSIMKLFLQSTTTDVLVNVGCCYHKLTESTSFPLSTLYKMDEIKLSNLGRSMACLNPYGWSRSNVKECTEQFRLKSYRYVLQHMLCEICGYDRVNSVVVRQASKTQSHTFGSFVFHTVMNLDDTTVKQLCEQEWMKQYGSIEFHTIESHLNEYYCKFQPNDKQVIKEVEVCWFFRSLIGPVIEHYILLDRLLFLRQDPRIEVAYLTRVFDMAISPRGNVIVAIKKKKD